jgi:hypothetical protein
MIVKFFTVVHPFLLPPKVFTPPQSPGLPHFFPTYIELWSHSEIVHHPAQVKPDDDVFLQLTATRTTNLQIAPHCASKY